jgi:hypothetical protein
MAVWAPSLRAAGYHTAEVDPSFIETEVFERLDSDSSGFLTLAEMEPLIAMSSNAKFKLQQRVATAITCSGRPGGGLSLPQFAAVFREDENKCVDNYYEKVAIEEMDGITSASPHTPKASPNHKSKMLQATDLEAELQASALASCSSRGLMTSPSLGFLSTSPTQTKKPALSPTAMVLQELFSPKVGFPAMPPSFSTTFSAQTLTAEALEARLEKAVVVTASPSASKAGEKSPAGNSQGSKIGHRGPRRSAVDASANTGAGFTGATPVKSKMTTGPSPAKSDKDGQEMHRNRDEVKTEILDVLEGGVCLQQGDFDFKVRQHLHAILGSSGRVKLHEALVAVRDVCAKKKRTDVRNWAAYIVKILQSFHNDASAAEVEEEVAEDQGAKADDLQEAMAEIQRLKEKLAAAKEEHTRDAASPAKRRASIGFTLAPGTDSEDEADEVDDQDELETFPAPPDSQSWEWPLSKHEKKVRIQLLERQIHAADRSALVREVKQVRRASLASVHNACQSDDEKLEVFD